MKSRIISLLLCAAVLLSLGGCAGSAPAPEAQAPAQAAPDPAQAPKPAEPVRLPAAQMLAVTTAPDLSRAGETSAAALGFAADLLRQTEGDNRLLSPLSVLCALGMVLGGAEGGTRSQMEAVLGASGEALNAFLGPWLAALAAEEGGALRVADGIWVSDRPDLQISEDFLRLNRECYGAAVEQCSLDAAALAQINAFVKQNTDGMIDKILDGLPEEAVMVLVNALSFEADWADPYREGQVHTNLFRPEAGAEQTVEFLHSQEHWYLSDGETVGFLKDYEGGRYAFAALLPPEGMKLEDYIAALTGEKLIGLLTGAKQTAVMTVTPKFETDYSVSLAEPLRALGMTDAFDGELADFSALGTCGNGDNIFLSQVVHKTFLKLDEKGTRAGAATAVIMEAASAYRDPPPQVVLDRPFVYLLLDRETNIPLFIGTVSSLG